MSGPQLGELSAAKLTPAYPLPVSPGVSSKMRQQRSRDTMPEVLLRKDLHRRGLRFRTHGKIVPGTQRSVDVVFARSRVAVFVDGCFWHGCPVHGRRHFDSNPDYWSAKIRRNSNRDDDTNRRLRAAGWEVVRVWEHKETTEAADLVEQVVRSRAGGR